jgi:hypothetical protein
LFGTNYSKGHFISVRRLDKTNHLPWFNCAICLVNHYDGMKGVVTQFDSESCIAIEKCPEIFADGIYQSKFLDN